MTKYQKNVETVLRVISEVNRILSRSPKTNDAVAKVVSIAWYQFSSELKFILRHAHEKDSYFSLAKVCRTILEITADTYFIINNPTEAKKIANCLQEARNQLKTKSSVDFLKYIHGKEFRQLSTVQVGNGPTERIEKALGKTGKMEYSNLSSSTHFNYFNVFNDWLNKLAGDPNDSLRLLQVPVNLLSYMVNSMSQVDSFKELASYKLPPLNDLFAKYDDPKMDNLIDEIEKSS